MQRVMRLKLPVAMGQGIPILYVQMDGTGVPMVRAETEGRIGKRDGQPATRAKRRWIVFSHKPQRIGKAAPYATKDPLPTWAIETADDFGLRLYAEAWQRGWARAEKQVA